MKKSDIAFLLAAIFGIALFIAYWLSRPPSSPTPAPAPNTAHQLDPLPPNPKPPRLHQPHNIPALIEQLKQLNAAEANLAADQLKKIGAPAVPALQAARAATNDALLLARYDDILNAIAQRDPQQPPAMPNLVAPQPLLPEAPAEQRTTTTRTFTAADGKQYRVTQITEGNKSRLTVDITHPATGQLIQRVEAANEAELARTNPQLFALIKQNENSGVREQIVQAPGRMSRIIIRGGGMIVNLDAGGMIVNLGGGGPPLPNLPRPESPASAPVGDFGAKLAETADGVRVIEIAPASRAAAIGLQTADILTKINGRQVNSLDDANELLQNLQPDTPLRLEVTRRGETVALP
jgi:hypothetical protein